MQMGNGFVHIYSQFFTVFSLLAFAISLFSYSALKMYCTRAIRVSLIGSCIVAVFASLIPTLAAILSISFLPEFIYHTFGALTLAPLMAYVIGFLGTWSTYILSRELYSLFHRSKPPQLANTLIALLLFVTIAQGIRVSILTSQVTLNASSIASYASTGTDPIRLEKIYTQVANSNDSRMFADLLARLAENPHSPPQLLRVVYARTIDSTLETTNRNNIILSLTKNPNTPSEILSALMLILSQEKIDPINNRAMASIPHNPNFTPETFQQLASYPDCEIRRSLISYPNISEDILNELIRNDPDVGVQHDARRRLEFLHGISRLEGEKKIPIKENKLLSQLPDAAKQTIDKNELQKIYTASQLRVNPLPVLENLASNCFMSDDLAHDLYVKAISSKSSTRTPILMALAANPVTPQDILNELAREKDLVILRALATNPHLPLGLISKLSPYPDCKIRKKLLCNINTSNPILHKLQHDSDESVSLEANERLRKTDIYLNTCKIIEKMNPSCQKFFSNASEPEVQSYPNTSQREVRFDNHFQEKL